MNGVSTGILLCAATRAELDAVPESLLEGFPGGGTRAVTGVGIPHTLLSLPPLLARHRPRLVVNVGIAGAYAGSGLAIGDVVLGVSETFADLGMELPDGEGFSPLGAHAFADPVLRAPLPLCAPETSVEGLRRARGATVNACTGTDVTGALRRRVFDVDFEGMEGAAAALAARAAGAALLEVRAISNFAARRDMRPENIARALRALEDFWTRAGRILLDAAYNAAHPKDLP